MSTPKDPQPHAHATHSKHEKTQPHHSAPPKGEPKLESTGEPSAEEQLAEVQDKYLRTLAELENLKKFSARQIQETANYAISKFAKGLLEVVDVFNKVESSVKVEEIHDQTFKSFVEGISLTKQTLLKVFKQFDITELGAELIGKPFDPTQQEVLTCQPNPNLPDDSIFQVFENGFLIKDKLLRAAKVGVVKN